MTGLEVARWVLGVFLALLAGHLAFATGRFMMALFGEDLCDECSMAFLHPVTRWLMYYLAVAVVTLVALLALPYWSAVFALLWVIWRWFLGVKMQMERGLPRYVQEMLSAEPTLSFEQARRRTVQSLYRRMRNRVLGWLLDPLARTYSEIYDLAYALWVCWLYRCPQCRRRLHVLPEARNGALRRYHCEQCDVIWDSGLDKEQD
jgi:hypothetical protein